MQNPQMVSPEVPTSAGESKRHQVDLPFSRTIRLKAERVEEKLALSENEGAKVAFSLELTADLQPVTIELAEPRVTLIVHGAQPGAVPVA